jgi:hypothetical protein
MKEGEKCWYTFLRISNGQILIKCNVEGLPSGGVCIAHGGDAKSTHTFSRFDVPATKKKEVDVDLLGCNAMWICR